MKTDKDSAATAECVCKPVWCVVHGNKDLLEEKFRVTSSRGIDLILMRIRENLYLE